MEETASTLGPNDPDTIASKASYTVTLIETSWYKEAEKIGYKVMKQREKILGAHHSDTLTSKASYALIIKNL